MRHRHLIFLLMPVPPLKRPKSGRKGRQCAVHLEYGVDDGGERRVVGDIGNVKDVRTPHVEHLQTLHSTQHDHTHTYSSHRITGTTTINDNNILRPISVIFAALELTADSIALVLGFKPASSYHLIQISVRE